MGLNVSGICPVGSITGIWRFYVLLVHQSRTAEAAGAAAVSPQLRKLTWERAQSFSVAAALPGEVGFPWASPSSQKSPSSRAPGLGSWGTGPAVTMILWHAPGVWLGRTVSTQIPGFGSGWHTLKLLGQQPIKKKKKSALNINISALLRAIVLQAFASLLLLFFMPSSGPGSTCFRFLPFWFGLPFLS